MTSRRPAPVRQEIIGLPRQHVPPGTEFKVAIVTTCDDRITAVDFTALLTRTVEVDPDGHYAAKAQSGLMGQTSSEKRVCKGHTLFQKFLVQKGRHIVNIPDVDGRGNNEAKLTLKIPDRCPDTWDGDNGLHGCIRYKFAAIMRYKRWNSECTSRLPIVNTLVTTKQVLVCNRVLIAPNPRPVSKTCKETFRSLALKKGELTATLSVPSSLLLGHAVPARVKVTNTTSRAITRASLSLCRRLTISNTRTKQRVKEKLSTVAVKGAVIGSGTQWAGQVHGLHVPQPGLSSASFSGLLCFFVSFFVRLHLQLKWVGSLNCDVEVEIGTSVEQQEEPEDNIRHNLLLRQEFEPNLLDPIPEEEPRKNGAQGLSDQDA